MQYVRSISGSVSKTWNSINPATLSGAIDVIVIEQEDGQSVLFVYFRPWVDLMWEFYRRRHSGLFTLPCPIRQVFSASSI